MRRPETGEMMTEMIGREGGEIIPAAIYLFLGSPLSTVTPLDSHTMLMTILYYLDYITSVPQGQRVSEVVSRLYTGCYCRFSVLSNRRRKASRFSRASLELARSSAAGGRPHGSGPAAAVLDAEPSCWPPAAKAGSARRCRRTRMPAIARTVTIQPSMVSGSRPGSQPASFLRPLIHCESSAAAPTR